jgi:hypothetical protein
MFYKLPHFQYNCPAFCFCVWYVHLFRKKFPLLACAISRKVLMKTCILYIYIYTHTHTHREFLEGRTRVTLLPSACACETTASSTEEYYFHLTLDMPHIINLCAFLNVNTLFKRLSITVDAQNVSLLLLSMLQVP